MWLYKSYREFIEEASGDYSQKDIGSTVNGGIEISPATLGDVCEGLPPAGNEYPPVIVACENEINCSSPMLEGRRRQELPEVPGLVRGWLLAGSKNHKKFSEEKIKGWCLPCRVGTDRKMVISIKEPKIKLRFDVSNWPSLSDEQQSEKLDALRRVANNLQHAPKIFSATPSITNAYYRLEKNWDNQNSGKKDPQVELLKKQAEQLQTALDHLYQRPRAMLQTEHSMRKLQDIRRTDAKTLQWLQSQPGRTTAERAGARQRIKAPKRYETVNTLENQVLLAFSALTVRATEISLADTESSSSSKEILLAHQFRAQRIVKMLRDRGVSEASPSVRPNFPLRFDPLYQKIWHSWLDLRRRSNATELDWMWQHRTFMQALGLRAAMLLNTRMNDHLSNGVVAHSPVIEANSNNLDQGLHLNDNGIVASYRFCRNDSVGNDIFKFCAMNSIEQLPLGAVSSISFTATSSKDRAYLWWNAPGYKCKKSNSIGVGAYPWNQTSNWDNELNEWLDRMLK